MIASEGRREFSIKVRLGFGALRSGYAAALLDGEGSISYVRFAKRKYPTFAGYVTIVNTDPRITEWLYDNFGGGVSVRQNGKYRPLFRWALNGSEAYSFLRLISPHLVAKRAQAELFLRIPPHAHGRTKDRLIIWDQMRRLNAGEKIKELTTDVSIWVHMGHPRRDKMATIRAALMKTCLECGGEYRPRSDETPSIFTKTRRKYCGPICAARANGRTLQQNRRFRWPSSQGFYREGRT